MLDKTYAELKEARRLRQLKRERPTRTKVKSSNPPRQKREKRRAYGTDEHRAWLHAQPCAVSHRNGTPLDPIVAAHTKGDGGAGRKASARYQIPMLDSLHKELHQYGAETFQDSYGVDLVGLAESHWRAWLAFSGENE